MVDSIALILKFVYLCIQHMQIFKFGIYLVVCGRSPPDYPINSFLGLIGNAIATSKKYCSATSSITSRGWSMYYMEGIGTHPCIL